jgi:hypothetical protein
MRRTLLFAFTVVTACGGSSRIADLSREGIHVAPEAAVGWYRLRTDEGYSLSLPGLPRTEREEFYFGGTAVPQRFFDLSTEAQSRGYLVRVFDARRLSEESREELREQALELFLPHGAEVVGRETLDPGEQLLVDGYSVHGHMGLLRSFVRAGFVWQMLLVFEPGGGGPSEAAKFFGSARVDEGAEEER